MTFISASKDAPMIVSGALTPYGPYVNNNIYQNTGYPILFNTSGQIRIKANGAGVAYLTIFGWIDPEGKE